jgi:sugar phosphate isomerase/epimerase
LPEIFKIARIAGFDGIELLIDSNNCKLSAPQIQDLSNEYNVPILSLHSPFVVCDGWGDFWEKILKSVEMAMELSIPLVNFHPPTGYILRHHLNDQLLEHINLYKDFTDSSDIILTIENLPTLRTFRRILINKLLPHIVNNMYKIADFVVNNNIYMTFDTTHIGTTGVDLLEAYNVFKDRIENIHLSDYDGKTQHQLPGEGYLPLRELLRQVKLDGYDGIITLETNPAAMEHEDKAKAAQNAEASLNYIKDAW